MRIIAGTAGSLPIKVPKSLTRPTTDRVREALFSSLGPFVSEAKVLDLYAGSGALGIEALRRGASSAVFVDSGDGACSVVRENLQKTRLKGGTVIKRTISAYLSSASHEDYFDLVFADPPYAKDERTSVELTELLHSTSLLRAITPEGTFVLESFAKSPLPETSLWDVVKEKTYGKTRVSFLKPTG